MNSQGEHGDDAIEEPVAKAIRRLEIISYRIRILTGLVPFLTFITLIFAVFLPVMRFGFPITVGYFDSIFFASLSLFSVIISGALVEIFVRRGDVIFEEVSDELQWKLDVFSAENNTEFKKRPNINIRIALRNFVTSNSVPFYRGVNGILFYIIVNITLLIIGVLIGTLIRTMR